MIFLLPIHILVGIFSLLSSVLVVFSGKDKRIHALSGRAYFWSMLVIFSCYKNDLIKLIFVVLKLQKTKRNGLEN